MTKIEWMPLEKLRPYERNPRVITEEAVERVSSSIRAFGFQNPILADAAGVIIAGHTRLLAARALGLEAVPVIIIDDLTQEQMKAFRLADNRVAEYSQWDTALLTEELVDLSEFEVDMSDFGFETTEISRRRASWSLTERYCDLSRCVKQHLHGDMSYTTLYAAGDRGLSLKEIKENAANVKMFADNLTDYVDEALGTHSLAENGWCVLTAPRRRHKKHFHFASAICAAAAEQMGIPFYVDAIVAKNRARVQPKFEMAKEPSERNVILFDDIVTTGETLRECRRLLLEAGCTVLMIAGIKN